MAVTIIGWSFRVSSSECRHNSQCFFCMSVKNPCELFSNVSVNWMKNCNERVGALRTNFQRLNESTADAWNNYWCSECIEPEPKLKPIFYYFYRWMRNEWTIYSYSYGTDGTQHTHTRRGLRRRWWYAIPVQFSFDQIEWCAHETYIIQNKTVD